MSTQAELEAALAGAEAAWRRANEDLDKARTGLLAANAEWDKIVSDRRKAEPDRRKLGSTWDRLFPDRRKAVADRRSAEADIAALAKAVSDRNSAYTKRSNAEADWGKAEARLKVASAERDRAIKALEDLKRAQK